jgi:hypothetical protein
LSHRLIIPFVLTQERKSDPKLSPSIQGGKTAAKISVTCFTNKAKKIPKRCNNAKTLARKQASYRFKFFKFSADNNNSTCYKRTMGINQQQPKEN